MDKEKEFIKQEIEFQFRKAKEFAYEPLPIEFKEIGHSYILEGLPMIGTTTVIGMKNKEFLKWWTVKLMYETLQAKWDLKKKYTAKEKETLLLLGKKAHTVKLDKACDSGTLGHALIERSIKDGKRYKIEDIKHFKKEVQEELRNIYKAWLAWEKTHKIRYVLVELVVGSREWWVAGMIDAVAVVDGYWEILDWKTSSQLSEEVFLQTGSYKKCLIECGVDESIKRRVVRLDKKTGEFEDHPIESDYEKDIICFLGLLRVYQWNREITKKNLFNKVQFRKKVAATKKVK